MLRRGAHGRYDSLVESLIEVTLYCLKYSLGSPRADLHGEKHDLAIIYARIYFVCDHLVFFNMSKLLFNNIKI